MDPDTTISLSIHHYPRWLIPSSLTLSTTSPPSPGLHNQPRDQHDSPDARALGRSVLSTAESDQLWWLTGCPSSCNRIWSVVIISPLSWPASIRVYLRPFLFLTVHAPWRRTIPLDIKLSDTLLNDELLDASKSYWSTYIVKAITIIFERDLKSSFIIYIPEFY